MEWLNYHHLRYFWTVAKEGSLAPCAAERRIADAAVTRNTSQAHVMMKA